jgi:hypothetical protein
LGGFGELAVGRLLAARTGHRAVARAALRGVDAPLLRRGFREHDAGLRARDAQLVPSVAHRGGATGDLAAEHRVDVHLSRRREVDSDPVQVHLELFRDQRGKRHHYALAHLGPRAQDGDAVVGADAHAGVHRRGVGCSLGAVREEAGQRNANDETPRPRQRRTSGTCGEPIVELGHDQAPVAALWMAARMRDYVPQRQMLLRHGAVDVGIARLGVGCQQPPRP